jgi:hypothetical protein
MRTIAALARLPVHPSLCIRGTLSLKQRMRMSLPASNRSARASDSRNWILSRIATLCTSVSACCTKAAAKLNGGLVMTASTPGGAWRRFRKSIPSVAMSLATKW